MVISVRSAESFFNPGIGDDDLCGEHDQVEEVADVNVELEDSQHLEGTGEESVVGGGVVKFADLVLVGFYHKLDDVLGPV